MKKKCCKPRLTNQKVKIITYLKSVNNHPTAEQVYTEVSKDLPQITLATVYRNLNKLAERGQILRIKINNEYHYDADGSNHQHLVCTNCGKIQDMFVDEISTCVLKNINDFDVSSFDIIIKGTCKECTT